MRTVAVDPGKWACGVAVFDSETLTDAWLSIRAKDQDWPVMVGNVIRRTSVLMTSALILELQKAYAGGKQEADPADLIQLAMIVGGFYYAGSASSNNRVLGYFPYEWKRQLNKEQIIERVKSRLAPGELSKAELTGAKTKDHNIWEAIGLGLFHLGRFSPKRVIAR